MPFLPWLGVLAARWASARVAASLAGNTLAAGARRFINGESLLALVAVAVLVTGLIAMIWLRHEIVQGRDGEWKDKLAKSRIAAAARQRARDQASAEAAADERRKLAGEIEAAAERAAELERQLADVAAAATRAGQDPDPVVFPQAVARSLRK